MNYLHFNDNLYPPELFSEHMKKQAGREMEYRKEYYAQHKEKINTYCKAYNIAKKKEISENKKKYYIKNRDKILEGKREASQDETFKARRKEYQATHRERNNLRAKRYRDNNRDKIKKYNKEFRQRHPEKVASYDKERWRNNPLRKLGCNTRSLIRLSFKRKGWSKKSKTYSLLGCEFEFFQKYLEEKFLSRYGRLPHDKEEIHLDHIIPFSTATSEEELIKLSHYTNLEWLTAQDNLAKGNKIL